MTHQPTITESYATMDRYCPGIAEHLRTLVVEHGHLALVRELAASLADTLRHLDQADRVTTLLRAEAILHGLDDAPALTSRAPDPDDPWELPADYLGGRHPRFPPDRITPIPLGPDGLALSGDPDAERVNTWRPPS